MNEVNQIMSKMSEIAYGVLNEDGINILDMDDGKSFNEIYHLLSPEELLLKKVGVCWDQVELERKLFKAAGIPHETYFIYIDDKKFLPSHTFLIFYNHNNVYWFEHAWQDEKGIHRYHDLKELLKDVKQKFFLSRKDEIEKNEGIFLYKYNQPSFNITCDEFYSYIFKQEAIDIVS